MRPEDIAHTGLLTVEGELDDISGSGQTAAAHGLCTSIPKAHRMHYEAKGAGHYGIFSGRRWREMVYPVVKSFILAHQPKAVAAETAPARKPAAKTVVTKAVVTKAVAPVASKKAAPKAAPARKAKSPRA